MNDPLCDFYCALEVAKSLAQSRLCDPTLVGWYDNVNGDWAPQKRCPEDREECEVINEFESGDYTVEVNDQDYIFVFRGYLGWQL